jgi:uncharacterized integral membrane protein
MIFLFAVLGVVALVIVGLFSYQNAMPVTVSFYNWRFDASLAIVVFLSALAGIVIEALFILSLRVRKSVKRRIRNVNKAGEQAPTPVQEDGRNTP